MKYSVVELEDFSGYQTTVYSVYVEELEMTLFERFVEENEDQFPDEIDSIIDRLYTIGFEIGARESFFKPNEGRPGDLVHALYDPPDKKLRLYCIRYSMDLIVIGGGGEKTVRAWEEDPKLTEEAEWMIKVSNDIYQKQREGEIKFSDDDKFFIGDLNFGYEEE